ncbi:hypothetical protein [Amycolatopsis sp. SID8362]|uniref:alpha/beta fold hydrolase n=1 Tax=Amycolatopsis sp. SID8362 TaxID=2690346 RepID=UPI00136968FE|nr:hypothetical protein [Amycolatopsis sp. SID8362]NBH06094.1 hypothetical protein [Amycolatopsis sp. SID8362]NED42793.1 hypothetical protein [Amycolatopsis sp. SID8362]
MPLALFGGTAMADPTLPDRLRSVAVPTLVVRGAADRIGAPAVGQAYAASIPGARVRLIETAGQLPQIETADDLIAIVWDFADAHATGKPAAATTIGILGSGRAPTPRRGMEQCPTPRADRITNPRRRDRHARRLGPHRRRGGERDPGSGSPHALAALDPALWNCKVVLDLANPAALATARAAEHWFGMFPALVHTRDGAFNLRIVGPRG